MIFYLFNLLLFLIFTMLFYFGNANIFYYYSIIFICYCIVIIITTIIKYIKKKKKKLKERIKKEKKLLIFINKVNKSEYKYKNYSFTYTKYLIKKNKLNNTIANNQDRLNLIKNNENYRDYFSFYYFEYYFKNKIDKEYLNLEHENFILFLSIKLQRFDINAMINWSLDAEIRLYFKIFFYSTNDLFFLHWQLYLFDNDKVICIIEANNYIEYLIQKFKLEKIAKI